jgi:hypothetical protein
LSEKESNGKVKGVAIEDDCWANGKKKCWIIRIHDEFKYKSEIKTIIRNLSVIKRDDDKVIVEDGESLNC